MQYIIMCGGRYDQWTTPRQLTPINGETIVGRTIRLLREHGVEDIAISATSHDFDDFGVPVLRHDNHFIVDAHCKVDKGEGKYWVDAFYPTDYPVVYIFGDVVFSPEAIGIIVGKKTAGIEFFASVPPFDPRYIKPWAEPFAFKVVDLSLFWWAVNLTKDLQREGRFRRPPIAWELWNVINSYDLNVVNFNGVTGINDYTCDIDHPEDVMLMERVVSG